MVLPRSLFQTFHPQLHHSSFPIYFPSPLFPLLNKGDQSPTYVPVSETGTWTTSDKLWSFNHSRRFLCDILQHLGAPSQYGSMGDISCTAWVIWVTRPPFLPPFWNPPIIAWHLRPQGTHCKLCEFLLKPRKARWHRDGPTFGKVSQSVSCRMREQSLCKKPSGGRVARDLLFTSTDSDVWRLWKLWARELAW